MSVPKPTPNNLTLVKFGPLSVDFTVTGTYTLGQLEYDEQKFIPTSSFIVYRNVVGNATTTFSTAAVVAIDNQTTGENIATATLPVAPVLTSPNTAGNLSQTILTPATNGYVLGQPPVANPNPAIGASGGGAASTQSLRVNVTTAAVSALSSVSRSTTNNISTVVVSAVPASIVAGARVKLNSFGNAAYNGVVTVISTTSTSFSFYNPTLTTEASTNDTAGKIGSLYGDVYVLGLLV